MSILTELVNSTIYIYFRGTESFPFPNNVDHYIEQLKQDTADNNKKRRTLSWGVGVASFASALLLAAI